MRSIAVVAGGSQFGKTGGRFGALGGRGAIERAMDATRVVIIREFAQLAHQVHGIPEEFPIEVLTAYRSNQPFDELMRDRSVRSRLEFLDLADAQIGEAAVKSKQQIMVSTGVLGQNLARAGAIEHPAYRHAIDGGGFDAEADYAAGENVLDQHLAMRRGLTNRVARQSTWQSIEVRLGARSQERSLISS